MIFKEGNLFVIHPASLCYQGILRIVDHKVIVAYTPFPSRVETANKCIIPSKIAPIPISVVKADEVPRMFFTVAVSSDEDIFNAAIIQQQLEGTRICLAYGSLSCKYADHVMCPACIFRLIIFIVCIIDRIQYCIVIGERNVIRVGPVIQLCRILLHFRVDQLIIILTHFSRCISFIDHQYDTAVFYIRCVGKPIIERIIVFIRLPNGNRLIRTQPKRGIVYRYQNQIGRGIFIRADMEGLDFYIDILIQSLPRISFIHCIEEFISIRTIIITRQFSAAHRTFIILNIMVYCRDRFLYNISAPHTGQLSHTVTFTGRLGYYFRFFIYMIKSCDLLICSIIAAGAGDIRFPACFGTSDGLCFVFYQIMVELGDRLAFTAKLHATHGTIYDLIVRACFCTRRRLFVFTHCFRGNVSFSRNFFICSIIALRASIIRLPARLGACRFLPFVLFYIMAKLCDRFTLPAKLYTANRTIYDLIV